MSKSTTNLTNKAYDKLKFLAQVLLPGIGAFYFALAGYWNFPKPDEVVGSITAFDTLLGLLLVFFSKQYLKSDDRFDGHVSIEDNEEEGTSQVGFHINPDSLTTKDEVTLKVRDLGRGKVQEF